MRETELYARILNIQAPWRVTKVELLLEEGRIVIDVEHDPNVAATCSAAVAR
ncbi:MAG: hypothetical protein R3B09_09605 [Nannocystaceae bacterium]